MWPISDAMAAELRGNHVVAQRVDVLNQDQVLATLDVAVEGSVTADRAAVQRSCDVQLVDALGVYKVDEAADLLSPQAGNDLRLWRGVRFPDGTEELVPLGTFRIAQFTTRGTTINLRGYDYAWVIQRARFERPYQVARGTNLATAILTLLEDRYPLVQTNFLATLEETALANFEPEADPWEAAQGLAQTDGKRLFFDPLGVAQLLDEPDPTTEPPVWEYVEGERGLLVEFERGLDVEGFSNAVLAVFSGDPSELAPGSAIPRGFVVDDDPDSPTYYYGNFGKAPRFYASPLLKTQAMAEKAARSLLQKELGVTESISFGGIVNPAHEIGDVVRVQRTSAGVDTLHVLDGFTMPMRASQSMTATTRARQAVMAL